MTVPLEGDRESHVALPGTLACQEYGPPPALVIVTVCGGGLDPGDVVKVILDGLVVIESAYPLTHECELLLYSVCSSNVPLLLSEVVPAEKSQAHLSPIS